jgi:protein-L-isoaspartate(D-aspartate) O-methyltransferase
MFDLDDCRRFYAEEIQFTANLTSPALIAALTRVPREKFLGPGPWHVGVPDMTTGSVQYIPTPDADPRRVYHNVTISLDRSRDLTNGQPGTLAHYINALNLSPGERVYHLGAGAGYYTAIIAEVVGTEGAVVASEVHPELGLLAQKNLADRRNVTLHLGDGTQFDPGECDAMLINAGVTHPLPLWLDRLRVGGRLLAPITMPMTPNIGKGLMFKITRQSGGYAAQVVSFVAIYSSTSARDAQREAALGKMLATGTFMKIKSVRRDQHAAEDTCAVHGEDVCLSLAAVESAAAQS